MADPGFSTSKLKLETSMIWDAGLFEVLMKCRRGEAGALINTVQRIAKSVL
jgi:hypothetical protein